MTFAVVPADLNLHASALRACADSTAKAKTYASEQLSLDPYEAGVTFEHARGKISELRDGLRSYLDVLEQADIASAIELDATASRSVALDDEVEAELDQAYPDSGVAVSLPPDVGTGSLKVTPPEAALVTPPQSAPTDFATEILTTNWLSPSTLLDQAIGLVTGLFGMESPFTRVGKGFGGDWDQLYGCGESVKNLARYLELQADARRAAMATSAQTWQGEAATAATTFFARQGNVLDEAAELLRNAQPEFDAVVRGMRSSAQLATGLMATVFDASLIAWGCYTAGAATAATGVGAIVGGICGTSAVGIAVYALYEMYTLCQNLLTLLDALSALIGTAMSFLMQANVLPRVSAYDNPQV